MTAPYTYVEFPKWVHRDGRPSVLVHGKEHEAALLAPTEPPTTADDKEILQAQAAELGIDVDRRWSAKRLQSEIDAALAAPPNADPQE